MSDVIKFKPREPLAKTPGFDRLIEWSGVLPRQQDDCELAVEDVQTGECYDLWEILCVFINRIDGQGNE